MNRTMTASRHVALGGALLLAAALPSGALTFEELDANGDGMISYGEMLVSVPSLTEEAFVSMDANGDQLIDPDELTAAMEAEILPPSDG
ncbi:MAG: hypothetical protein ACWA47_02305 [Brevirhabdus sp.]